MKLADRFQNKWLNWRAQTQPNLRGVTFVEPGHFYSPLLDIESATKSHIPNDDAAMWECLDLRVEEQKRFYQKLEALEFSKLPSAASRYYDENGWFPRMDAWVLSSIIRQHNPARYLEIGSGFSTAVVLDALEQAGGSTKVSIVEPDLSRLRTLLREGDEQSMKIHECPVQQLPLQVFDEFEAGDVLFIDSSHVAKVGSDVSFLFLRVLPRLKPGVWVQVHDIFYPESYPLEWVHEGRAWNESLFLRAFLVGRSDFEVRAFNSMALKLFPELLQTSCPGGGCSFWMQRR